MKRKAPKMPATTVNRDTKAEMTSISPPLVGVEKGGTSHSNQRGQLQE